MLAMDIQFKLLIINNLIGGGGGSRTRVPLAFSKGVYMFVLVINLAGRAATKPRCFGKPAR